MGMDREAEAGERSLRTPADREGRRRLSFRVGDAQNGHRWGQQQVFILPLRLHIVSGFLNTRARALVWGIPRTTCSPCSHAKSNCQIACAGHWLGSPAVVKGGSKQVLVGIKHKSVQGLEL